MRRWRSDMIVILEGSNGVGKSTYAQELSKQFGVPIFRPFRHGNVNLHRKNVNQPLDGLDDLGTSLRRFGVEVNTHIEDFYAADFLGAIGSGAILDRSLPSALAYGQLGRGKWDKLYRDMNQCQQMMDVWQDLLGTHQGVVLYVWLTCEHTLAKERGDGWKPTAADRKKLERMFALAFKHIKMKKLKINTGDIRLCDGVNQIVNMALSSQEFAVE